LSSSPSSLSPPNPTSPSRSVDYQPYQPTQSDLYSSLSGSVTESVSSTGSSSSTVCPSGESSSSESTITKFIETVVESNGQSALKSGTVSNLKGLSIPIPTSIHEEEEQRSRHPTPANSPVTSVRPVLPVAPAHISAPGITIYTIPPSPDKPSSPQSNTSSGRRDVWDNKVGEQPQVGTLVGRAVDIVTSARGLLGSLWQTGTA